MATSIRGFRYDAQAEATLINQAAAAPEGARGDDPRHRGARKAREEFGTQGPGEH